MGINTLLLMRKASLLGLLLLQVGVSLIQPGIAARAESSKSTIAQNNESAAAEKAYAEAEKLFQQRTAESLKQAIAKYETALKLWRAAGDVPKEALTLQAIGLSYYALGDIQKSLEYYEKVLAIHRSRKDIGREAALLTSIASNYSNLGQKQKAIESYQQALTLFDRIGANSFKVFALIGIASVYQSMGNPPEALKYYNQALEIQKTEGDKAGVASTLQNIGQLYISLGENQKGLEYFNQALPIVQAIKDVNGEASTRLYIGMASLAIGNNQQALESFNQAIPLFQKAGNLGGEALALQTLGGVYNALNQPQESLEYYQRGLKINEKIGFLPGQAAILNSIALVYNELGEKQKALESYNQALVIRRATKDPAQIADTLNRIGEIYSSLGEKQKALDTYNEALAMQKQANDRPGEAKTLNLIGQIYTSLGDDQSALKSFLQALSIFQQADDRLSEASTLSNISSVYSSLEDYPQALNYANQTLASYRTQQNSFGEATTLSTIIRIYESLGEYQKALDAANEILAIATSQKSSFLEATGLIFKGRVYRAMGNYPQALTFFNQALPLVSSLKSPLIEARTFDNFGKTYDLSNQPQKSLETYKQALARWQRIGDRTGEAETLYSIANIERKQGNLQASLSQIEAVLKIVESLRTKVASQELRTSYFASVQKYYQFYIDLLMQLHKTNPKQGYDAQALEASERARARSLLDILAESRADVRTGADPELLQQERSLQQQLNAKEEKRLQLLSGQSSEEQQKAIEQEIETLLNQYQQLQTQIRTKNPRYAALTQPQPLTLAEIQQQVLDDNTVLLEYSLGEERSYLWAVTKTDIVSYELPKRADIEIAVKRLRQALVVPRLRLSRKESVEAASALSEIILKPVAGKLGQKRLIIVADGALQYAPFSALSLANSQTNNRTPLIAEHEIVTLPSASTLAVLRQELNGRKPANKTLAVLADPVFTSDDDRIKLKSRDRTNSQAVAPGLERSAREAGLTFTRLPFTRSEAEQILALVPPSKREQTFDFAASRSAATSSNLAEYQIVHFATHGILNSTHPELSGVVLSLVDEKGMPQNGFLRLHDVFNLKLPAELVVLSACETGLGQQIKGEGLVGLTRGFMYAGAKSVVVSLWKVDDLATSELMTKFYRKMLKEGLKPSAALKAAQVEMSQDPQWSSPYYWAGFVIQGEWK